MFPANHPSLEVEPYVRGLEAKARYLDDTQIERLKDLLRPLFTGADALEDPDSLDTTFDLREEIMAHVRAVRYIRQQIFTPDSRINTAADIGDLKAFVGTVSSLLTLLMKYQEGLEREQRMVQVEKAVVDALREFDEELDRYLEAHTVPVPVRSARSAHLAPGPTPDRAHAVDLEQASDSSETPASGPPRATERYLAILKRRLESLT